MGHRRKHVSQWQARDAFGRFAATPSSTQGPARGSPALVGGRSSTTGPIRGISAAVGRPPSTKGQGRGRSAVDAGPFPTKGRARGSSAMVGGRSSTNGPICGSSAAVGRPSSTKGRGCGRSMSGSGPGRWTSTKAVEVIVIIDSDDDQVATTADLSRGPKLKSPSAICGSSAVVVGPSITSMVEETYEGKQAAAREQGK